MASSITRANFVSANSAIITPKRDMETDGEKVWIGRDIMAYDQKGSLETKVWHAKDDMSRTTKTVVMRGRKIVTASGLVHALSLHNRYGQEGCL